MFTFDLTFVDHLRYRTVLKRPDRVSGGVLDNLSEDTVYTILDKMQILSSIPDVVVSIGY